MAENKLHIQSIEVPLDGELSQFVVKADMTISYEKDAAIFNFKLLGIFYSSGEMFFDGDMNRVANPLNEKLLASLPENVREAFLNGDWDK